jgi:hypothetical protein
MTEVGRMAGGSARLAQRFKGSFAFRLTVALALAALPGLLLIAAEPRIWNRAAAHGLAKPQADPTAWPLITVPDEHGWGPVRTTDW